MFYPRSLSVQSKLIGGPTPIEGNPRLARETGHTLEVHRKALQSARAALHQR